MRDKEGLSVDKNKLLQEELKRWNRKTVNIVSLSNLLHTLQEGWRHHKVFISYPYKPQFLVFLELLKKRGYIETFCILPGLPDKLEFLPALIVCALPEASSGGPITKGLYVYTRNRQALSITYKQIVYLSKKTQQTLLFSTNCGVMTQTAVLKKKIGGLLLCSFY